jgi:hypothetical protein
MHVSKQAAIAAIGAIAWGGAGVGAAAAADIPVQPPVYQRAAPQYVPAPVEEEYTYAPPPVVYRYAAPPPVVYYDAPPVVVYPPRYRYGYAGYAYPRYRDGYGGYGPRYRGYGPYAHGYGHRHWRR